MTDHVTCCCTETRETIQRLEAAYGAANQRLAEAEASLAQLTGERDRARGLAARLLDQLAAAEATARHLHWLNVTARRFGTTLSMTTTEAIQAELFTAIDEEPDPEDERQAIASAEEFLATREAPGQSAILDQTTDPDVPVPGAGIVQIRPSLGNVPKGGRPAEVDD